MLTEFIHIFVFVFCCPCVHCLVSLLYHYVYADWVLLQLLRREEQFESTIAGLTSHLKEVKRRAVASNHIILIGF